MCAPPVSRTVVTGIRGSRLPDAARARTARRGRILATGMLVGGLLTLVGFGVDAAPIAWIGLVLGVQDAAWSPPPHLPLHGLLR